MPTDHLIVLYCTATTSRATCTGCSWRAETGDVYPFRSGTDRRADGEPIRRKRKLRNLEDCRKAHRDHFADINERRHRVEDATTGEPADEVLARHGVVVR